MITVNVYNMYNDGNEGNTNNSGNKSIYTSAPDTELDGWKNCNGNAT